MPLYNFKLPDIGEGTAEAEIVAWYVKAGDRITEEQPLLDVMTEKATVELTAPVTGTVVEIRGDVGQKAAVGSVVVVFEVETSQEAAGQTPSETAREEARPSSSSPVVSAAGAPPAAASPAVRRRAAQLGIDLQLVKGSGPDGRITDRDLDDHKPAAAQAGAEPSDVTRVPIIGLRRQISERMALSKQKIPHFCYVEEIDVTDLWHLKDSLNAARGSTQPKLTVLPFLMRAIVLAVQDHPNINATYDDAQQVLNQSASVHIGIATQTKSGLFVPVVRHAERRDLWANAAEVAALAERARAGKSKREELSGSTITITSLGENGGLSISPIINYPEVAIIGPNKAVDRPVGRDGKIVLRKMMNLSGAFDHRIVDGYEAAVFVQRLRGILEQPQAHLAPGSGSAAA